MSRSVSGAPGPAVDTVGQTRIPGARYSFSVVAPRAPVLQVRYRAGVIYDAHGFPMWRPYARAVVEVPATDPGRGRDEQRIVNVLLACEVMRLHGRDPLWANTTGTPRGWTWIHLPMCALMALVPVELHAAFLHLGGVATMTGGTSRAGLDVGPAPRLAAPVPAQRVDDAGIATIETHFGYQLPPAYRAYLAATNGGRPPEPAVHPRHGFILDQELFGLMRDDWMHDLTYANGWFGDGLTSEYLAIGLVHGGLLALRKADGSVWYLDDDDWRDADEYDATYRCAHLMHRVGDDFADFWGSLTLVPERLRRLVAALAAGGQAREVTAVEDGADLPLTLRRPAPGS